MTSRERQLHAKDNVVSDLHRRLADTEQRLSGEMQHASGLASEASQARMPSPRLLVYQLDWRPTPATCCTCYHGVPCRPCLFLIFALPRDCDRHHCSTVKQRYHEAICSRPSATYMLSRWGTCHLLLPPVDKRVALAEARSSVAAAARGAHELAHSDDRGPARSGQLPQQARNCDPINVEPMTSKPSGLLPTP